VAGAPCANVQSELDRVSQALTGASNNCGALCRAVAGLVEDIEALSGKVDGI